jgi:hypothetical protein
VSVRTIEFMTSKVAEWIWSVRGVGERERGIKERREGGERREGITEAKRGRERRIHDGGKGG